MPNNATRYGVLICVDGSPESDAAVVWAAREAVMRSMPVTLLHVVAPVVTGWPAGQLHAGMPEWQKDDAQKVIDQASKVLVSDLGETKSPEVHTEIVYSSVVQTLIQASKDARMIVVGSQGVGTLGRLLLGSVTTSLLHHSHCPVAVIHSDWRMTLDSDRPVLVGIDGSPASELAAAVAFDEAARRGVELRALHAWSDVALFGRPELDWQSEADRTLAECLAGYQERYPDVKVQRLVVFDRPGRELIEAAKTAQLVVVGSHGRGGFTGMLLGSVSSTVAHSVRTPVIVARPS